MLRVLKTKDWYGTAVNLNESSFIKEKTMVIIPESQMVLMRKRRQLNQLIKEQKWDDILCLERQLYDDITAAVQDPQRSPKELLAELGGVIGLYKELSAMCRLYSKTL
ncbi:MAG: hypothetical protein ACI8VC_000714 [Candidatus Endobugula sp.]